MSYTMTDWVFDNFERGQAKEILERLVDDHKAIVRFGDMESLARFARAQGLDPEDNAQWDTDDELRGDALMALSNWAKERRDWEGPR